MSTSNQPRGHWTSRMGFILAATGSAVGLGNIWKFPYITGQNGGGAFVLVYLVCILFIGLPIMMAEFAIGRRGQRDAVGSFAALEGARSPWCLVGWGGIVASFILLSFYAVVAGWSFDYIVKSIAGSFSGLPAKEVSALFGKLVSSPAQVIFWQAFFMATTVGVVICGVRKGIERWSKILMPLLFLLLVFLFIRGMFSPGAGAALEFMFRPDFSSLTSQSILEAMGHAFFTLSLGAGTMITYGSYLGADADIFSLSVRITILDTIVALLAGLAIFPIVFAAGLESSGGPGLVFQTIPIVFSTLPFGQILAIIFFILLSFAALSSSISMLEVSVAYLIDEKGLNRTKATCILGALAFLFGLPCALSFNLWAEVTPFWGKTFFDFYDLLVSTYLLPIGGLLVAVYAGWFWKGEEDSALLGNGNRPRLHSIWKFLLRFVAPVSIILIILNQVGAFG